MLKKLRHFTTNSKRRIAQIGTRQSAINTLFSEQPLRKVKLS